MNNVNMNTVAQKLINKLAVAEYNNALLETKNEELEAEVQCLKNELENNKKDEKDGE
ncbi:hypothetical protein O2U01_00465 [Ligilactobacillus salivarius]|uniref:Phage protein n=1 Tax=Ligilactobacillus salivarius TaxID=1624 RepID=A0ABD7YU86_9LACO|nr:hypothetical protein [Ligilactobacillus salivarius]WHS06327.1 hypothetical protein O2U07_03260 [Ligilactobacillus salivarius]WHS07590.1 hypothetical protein O2U05_07490 [Ligilactobacillus salivarius]WHS10246.1 hypothetical protein O2U04_01335 [Ligilactobacillus salivarius]WHS14183.1 hypothetical protein O2U03_00550 [Ligilactobacillus salivarius]WHS17201.1 hypothetical protein O2U02_06885 [Ligilactobacillus salivarius]